MRTLPRVLFAFTALCLLGGSVIHTSAYPKASAVIESSGLRAPYAAMFRGLWLNDSVVLVFLGLSFALLAVWPRLGTRPLVVMLALLLIASATSMYATMGNFFPAHLLLVSGVAALIAGVRAREAA